MADNPEQPDLEDLDRGFNKQSSVRGLVEIPNMES